MSNNISYVDIGTDEELGLLKEALYDPDIKPFISKLKDTSFADDKLEELIKEAFIDGDNRMFPKHTPEHALVSAIYAHYQPDVPELIKTAAVEAAKEWGIEPTFAIPKLVKTASEEDFQDFLLPSRGKLPVVDRDSLLKSAGVLEQSFKKLSTGERVEGATRLAKYAAEYSIPMNTFSDEIVSYSMEAPSNLKKLSRAVTDRRIALGKDGAYLYSDFLSKVARFHAENGGDLSFDKDKNGELAVELLSLDKQAGISDDFNAVLDTFNSPFEEDYIEKEASVPEQTVSIGEYEFPLSKLASVPEDVLQVVLPSEADLISSDGSLDIDKLEAFADELTTEGLAKLGEILESL